MTESAKEKERAAQVVVLAPGHDPTRLRLTAPEGYLLSRIDGRTPWRLLREIGGIPAQEVDACLERWLDQGLLQLVGADGKPAATPATNATPQSAAARPANGSTSRHGEKKPLTKVHSPMDAASVPKDEPAPIPIDAKLLDPALDIDCAVQRRILEFEHSLARPYHELLGVPVGADPKTVKRAYFKLSKEFHPDRYFRKQIGPYAVRLERIFKKVLEAHEILSDPDLCQIENQPGTVVAEAVDPAPTAATGTGTGTGAAPASPLAAAPLVTPSAVPQPVSPSASSSTRSAPNSASASSTATSTAPSSAVPPREAVGAVPVAPAAETRPLSKLERLKQRMPFKIDHAAFAARRARALEIFRAAEVSLEAGRLNEAEANIRIAITFDPSRSEFKEALGSLRIRAAGDRAAKLLATPSDKMTPNELRDALQLLEDVLPYRPHDPELNARAAQVCLQLGQHDEAAEYAATLLERAGDVAAHHSLLGRIERARGDLVAARRAYEKAIELDKQDLEAGRALASMRIAAHDAARGGRR